MIYAIEGVASLRYRICYKENVAEAWHDSGFIYFWSKVRSISYLDLTTFTGGDYPSLSDLVISYEGVASQYFISLVDAATASPCTNANASPGAIKAVTNNITWDMLNTPETVVVCYGTYATPTNNPTDAVWFATGIRITRTKMNYIADVNGTVYMPGSPGVISNRDMNQILSYNASIPNHSWISLVALTDETRGRTGSVCYNQGKGFSSTVHSGTYQGGRIGYTRETGGLLPTEVQIEQATNDTKLLMGLTLAVCFSPDPDGEYYTVETQYDMPEGIFYDSLIRFTVIGDPPPEPATKDYRRAEFIVPEVVHLGSPFTVTVRPDLSTYGSQNPRKTSMGDWVGLFRAGECAEGNVEFNNHWKRRMTSPNPGIPSSEYQGSPSTVQDAWIKAADHAEGGQFSERRPFDYNPDSPTVANMPDVPIPYNLQHECYVSWEMMPTNPGFQEYTFTFEFNDYFLSGEYDLRYFYGDETHEGGYQCGLREFSGRPTTTETQCLLVARGTSKKITILPKGSQGTGWDPEGLPGLENYCDGSYGSYGACNGDL